MARQEFAAHGYAGATMRGIAAAAGVTPMALYNYAPSKSALFVTAWDDSIEQVYADYEQVVAGQETLIGEVDALLDRSRQLLSERPEHIRLVLRVVLDHGHSDLAHADLQPQAAAEFYARLADRGVQRGEITTADRSHLITFVVTLLWGMTTLAAFDLRSLDGVVASAKWAVRRHLA